MLAAAVRPLPPSQLTSGGTRRKNPYEPLLLENEREAVADLLQYLESESNPHLN